MCSLTAYVWDVLPPCAPSVQLQHLLISTLTINLSLFSKVTHRNVTGLEEINNSKEVVNTHHLHSLHIQVTVA